MVRKVLLENMGHKGYPVYKELKVQKVFMIQRSIKLSQVLWVPRDLLGYQETEVWEVSLGFQEQLDLKVLQDYLVLQD